MLNISSVLRHLEDVEILSFDIVDERYLSQSRSGWGATLREADRGHRLTRPLARLAHTVRVNLRWRPRP